MDTSLDFYLKKSKLFFCVGNACVINVVVSNSEPGYPFLFKAKYFTIYVHYFIDCHSNGIDLPLGG